MGTGALVRVFRFIAILVGLLLSAVGVLTIVSTIAGLILVGFSDTLDTGDTEFKTKTAAIGAEADGLGDVDDRFWGSDDKANIKVAASSDQDLFVGIGPKDKVQEYLDQAPWNQVDALSSGRFSSSVDNIDYSREGRAGAIRDLPTPADQTFWTTSKTGTDVTLDWDFRNGDYMVVLMNANGTPDVAADGKVELNIPRLSLALVGGAIFGLVLLLLGLLFLFKVGRGRGPSSEPIPTSRSAPSPA